MSRLKNASKALPKRLKSASDSWWLTSSPTSPRPAEAPREACLSSGNRPLRFSASKALRRSTKELSEPGFACSCDCPTTGGGKL